MMCAAIEQAPGKKYNVSIPSSLLLAARAVVCAKLVSRAVQFVRRYSRDARRRKAMFHRAFRRMALTAISHARFVCAYTGFVCAYTGGSRA